MSLPEDESPPLFHELGEGVDPKDLDMSQALSTSTNMGKKSRGVSGRGNAVRAVWEGQAGITGDK